MRTRPLALLAAAALATACEGDPDSSEALEIAEAPVGGDGQTGTVGQPLPAPLGVVVRVTP